MIPLPKEHGAYAQMATPLVTALTVAGATAASVAAAAALVLGFVAHEPLLVAIGGRGGRARREAGAAAWRWLAAMAGLAALAGVLAVGATPADVRWTFLLPVVPALLVLAAAVRGQEKRWPAEVLVALAFSLAAVPVCQAAGADARRAWSVATPFAVLFVAATLAVRGVILTARAAASPAGARASRVAAAVVAAAGVVALAGAALQNLLPWVSAMAAGPGALAATALAVRPPPPRHLHAVGWTLGGVSLAAAVVLMAGA